MVVPQVGRLVETGDVCDPYRLVDGNGSVVEAVTEFFRDLHAAGRSTATLRSYGLDLLRWFRFLWAIGIPWSRATRIEARDFCRWMLVAGKPRRPHWRHHDGPVEPRSTVETYAPSVRTHCETVLRCFYDFHLGIDGSPLLINAFPLSSSRRGGRVHAHHNPMEPFANERTGLYRPRILRRILPDPS
jgi:Phage integrase, N-terminal SAM-like domain